MLMSLCEPKSRDTSTRIAQVRAQTRMLRERRCALLFPGRSKIKKNEHVTVPESDTIAVLKVKLHCPACVSEVTRSLQRLNGVMEVSADAKAEMITVKGIQLEARRLCEAVLKRTGKRCEVVLLSSIEEIFGNSESAPATSNLEQVPMQETMVGTNEAAAAITVTEGTLEPVHQQSTSSDHNLHDISDPPIEINHQTHTVFYGWPSHFPSTPPLNYSSPALDYSYYVHDPDFRYEELLSDENPNACKVM